MDDHVAALLRTHVTSTKRTKPEEYNFFVTFDKTEPVPVLLDTGSSVNTITKELSEILLETGTVEPLPPDHWRRSHVPPQVKLADGTAVPVTHVGRTVTNDTTVPSTLTSTPVTRCYRHHTHVLLPTP